MSNRYGRGWKVTLPAIQGFGRADAFAELLAVKTRDSAERFVDRRVDIGSGDRDEVVAAVQAEGVRLSAAADLYYLIRQGEAGDVGMSEVRRIARDLIGRRASERIRTDDDALYLWNLGQVLLNTIDARIRGATARLVRRADGPLAFTFLLQGANDFRSEVYLHLAGLLVERRPLAKCAAPDCGQLFEPWGKARYHETRCQTRHRKQRYDARRKAASTHTRTH